MLTGKVEFSVSFFFSLNKDYRASTIFSFCRCTGTASATQELLFVVKSSDLTETSQLGLGYNHNVLSALTGVYIVDAPGRDEIKVQQRVHCSHVQEIRYVKECTVL